MGYKDSSDWSRCDACGACLMECPVLELGAEEAKREMAELLSGGPAKKVLASCTLCFDCNRLCPKGLRPHDLILDRVMAERKGTVPGLVPYLLNGMPQPTLFPDLYRGLSPEEQDVLDRWEQPPEGAREVLWVGCVGRLSCADIDRSKTLAPLAKYGPREACCGELQYRLGSFAAYEDRVEATFALLEKLDTEVLVCYCGSCYNFLTNIMPKALGKTLPYRVVSLYEWLAERLDRGEIRVEQPLELTAAVHESCYVSELGEGFGALLRNLYEAAGVDCVELPHHGSRGLSCGAASFARCANPAKSVLPAQVRKYRDVRASGVRDVALNCPGCYLTMAPTSRLAGLRLHYMPELLLRAFGDEQRRPLKSRWGLLTATMARRLPMILKRVSPELPRMTRRAGGR